MESKIPLDITYAANSMPWLLSSAEPGDRDDFLALFDYPYVCSEPLEATQFAQAQDLCILEDFHGIVSQNVPFHSRMSKHGLIPISESLPKTWHMTGDPNYILMIKIRPKK